MRISGIGILLSMLLAAGSCSGQKGMPATGAGKAGDTIMIAEHQRTYTLEEQHPQITLSLPIASLKVAAGARYFLTLRNVRQQESPDGAYELYLSGAQLSPAALTTDAPGFITVLDTYALNSGEAKRDLRFEVGRAAAAILRVSGTSSLWVTIHFRGNGLPEGGESPRAGRLSLDGVNLKMLR